MKYHLLILLSLLLVPVIGLAATTDFTANANFTVSAVTFDLSTADMLVMNSSTAEGWTYNAGAFTVTNPDSTSPFKISSSDSSVKSIQATLSGSTVACAENSTPGTSYLSLPTGSGTYTIVPSATTACTNLCTALSNTASYNSFPTCGAASCSSGYRLNGSGSGATCVMIGGGGIMGGGGGGFPAPVYTVIQGTATASRTAGLAQSQIDAIIALLQSFSAEQAVIDSVKSSLAGKPAAASTGAVISAVFSSGLGRGMTSTDVRRLQQLLNKHADTQISSFGTGSPGNETEYFGSLTEKAVQKFQKKYNITTEDDSAYGYVGPKTRAKIQEVFSK
ncbi:MAG: peptidoglycan-binding domain-containing protein [Candidatus Paceibacterota bacterium]